MKKSIIALIATALAVGSWHWMQSESQAAPSGKLEMKLYEDAECDDDDDDPAE
ncbi:MAG: hypothetical protein AAGH72_12990 [Verrucomicrobiota bacterium]